MFPSSPYIRPLEEGRTAMNAPIMPHRAHLVNCGKVIKTVVTSPLPCLRSQLFPLQPNTTAMFHCPTQESPRAFTENRELRTENCTNTCSTIVSVPLLHNLRVTLEMIKWE